MIVSLATSEIRTGTEQVWRMWWRENYETIIQSDLFRMGKMRLIQTFFPPFFIYIFETQLHALVNVAINYLSICLTAYIRQQTGINWSFAC